MLRLKALIKNLQYLKKILLNKLQICNFQHQTNKYHGKLWIIVSTYGKLYYYGDSCLLNISCFRCETAICYMIGYFPPFWLVETSIFWGHSSQVRWCSLILWWPQQIMSWINFSTIRQFHVIFNIPDTLKQMLEANDLSFKKLVPYNKTMLHPLIVDRYNLFQSRTLQKLTKCFKY